MQRHTRQSEIRCDAIRGLAPPSSSRLGGTRVRSAAETDAAGEGQGGEGEEGVPGGGQDGEEVVRSLMTSTNESASRVQLSKLCCWTGTSTWHRSPRPREGKSMESSSTPACRPGAGSLSIAVSALLCSTPCMAGIKKRIASIPQLTDVQLLQEINNADLTLAQLGVSAQYLAYTRPAPTYTLTGTSFYTGTFWHYGNTGQFTFHGQSIYQLTPNYGAQLGYAIAQAVVAARIHNQLRYRTALLNEVVARSARRETASRTTVDSFYAANPDLIGHEGLVASVAPWIAKENVQLGTPDLLGAVASRARTVVAQSRDTLSGDWFGLLVQQNTFPDGSSSPFWLNIRARLVEDRGTLSGTYDLIDGSQGVIRGSVVGSVVQGDVANVTYGLAFRIVGEAKPGSLIVDFLGDVTGTHMEGRAVLVR